MNLRFASTGQIAPKLEPIANLTIELDKKSPHFEIKEALLLHGKLTETFQIDLHPPESLEWSCLINYARFVTYKGDPVALTNANNKAVSEGETEYFAMTAGYG